ncbi:MAG: TldD/PmbA family protein [Alphaproteobacteria bacterium]|nr:MAG: TldD/PmbA family protein [Alphaproteobacteria bacterium]
MTDMLETLAHALIDAARKAGAEAADALAVSGESLSVELHNTALDQAERAEGIDIGLRVLIGRRQACVSASDARPETIAALAERAVAMAREAPEDPWAGLAEPDQLAREWDLAALDIDDPAPAPEPGLLEARAAEAARAALAERGISQVESAGAGWSRTRLHLAATNGFSGGYARSAHSVHCSAIAGEGTGMQRDFAYEMRCHGADMPPAEEVGRRAGQRASALIGAGRPPTGSFPVLYDERVASGLIGHLVNAVNGAAIARGSSWLIDALGERVLPAGLDLVEEPLRPRGTRSRPFDGEGLPTARREILRDGVLTGWTLDLATARKLGMQSTGNAARGTGAPPSPSVGNLRLSPGERSPEALRREMGTGLLVTSMIGSTVNPTTGDYSRGAVGFWVENGEIARPVNEFTIAGNLRDMLKRVIPANDGREYRSRIVPSLLVEGLTIAGA